jgi:hypothetical protein
MMSGGRQIIGLLTGAFAMAGVMFVTGEADDDAASRSCQPSAVDLAQDRPAHPQTDRLARITLPAPPPIAAAVVASPPRVSPPPESEPAVDRKTEPAWMPLKETIGLSVEPKRVSQPARATTMPLRAGNDQESTGRPLLRLLEHGVGPSVEIAWPEHAVARGKLYGVLLSCHGLKTVLLRDQEILMSTRGDVVERFNGDLHSGFIRSIQGPSPKREVRRINKLLSRHGAGGTVPVRLLSRQFDARLLGGLRNLVGADYRRAKSVTARYAVAGKRVMVHGLSVDGRNIEGRVEIDPPGRCQGNGA